jgi:hypothetical protein
MSLESHLGNLSLALDNEQSRPSGEEFNQKEKEIKICIAGISRE